MQNLYKNMQFVGFYQPNGFPWEMQDYHDVDTDRSRIVTHPVRRYFHGKQTQYTILACADIRKPYKIFYDVEISRPNDIEFPSSPYKDIRIFKQLMKEFPVSEQNYIKAEIKLRQKVDDARVQYFEQRRNELMNRMRTEMLSMKQYEIIEEKTSQCNAIITKINASSAKDIIEYQTVVDKIKAAERDEDKMANIENAGNDNDDNGDDNDDCECDILGVYARGD